MSSTLVFTDPDRNNRSWTARIRRDGDAHGRELCLVHSGEPVIEFYDRTATENRPDGGAWWIKQNGGNDWGQFVSSYFVTTLFPTWDAPVGGLDLHAGTPAWILSASAMTTVRDWAKGELAVCVLTAENIATEDDCTTHDHK